MKSSKDLKSGAGVNFHRNVEMVSMGRSHAPVLEQAVNLGLLLLASYSILFVFIGAFAIPILPGSFKTILFLETLFLWAVFLKKSVRAYTITGAALVFLLAVFFNWPAVMQGFFHVVNYVIRSLNSYYGVSLNELIPPQSGAVNLLAEADAVRQQTAFLLALAFFVVFLLALVICANGSRFLFALLTAAFVILPFAAGIIPKTAPFLAYLASAIAIMGNGFRMQPGVRARVKLFLFAAACVSCLLAAIWLPQKKYKEVFQVEKMKQTVQDNLQRVMEGRFGELAIFPSTQTAYGGLSNGELGSVNEVSFSRNEVLEVTIPDTEHFGKFYLRSFVGSHYTPGQWKGLKEQERDYLEVLQEGQGDELDHLQSQKTELLYRLTAGYGIKWTQIFNGQGEWLGKVWRIIVENQPEAEEHFKSSQAFPFYEKALNKSFKVPEKFLRAVNVAGEKAEKYFESNPVLLRVKNMESRDKNYYLPYLMTEDAKEDSGGSLALAGAEKGEYAMDYLYDWDLLTTELWNSGTRDDEYFNAIDFMEARFFDILNGTYVQNQLPEDAAAWVEKEKAYREFAYETYTALPASGASEAIRKFEEYRSVREETGQLKDKAISRFYSDYQQNIKEAVDDVKSFLQNNAVYDLAPGKLPKGKDFIDYFLFENRKGYCSYFATAATVLFRSTGIPARYVEGYVVTSRDYQLGENGKEGRVMRVKDTNAHAWTEIYINGWGWVPIETTPGFEGEGLPDAIRFSKTENQGVSDGTPMPKRPSVSPAQPGNPPIAESSRGKDSGIGAAGKKAQLPPSVKLILSLVVLFLAAVLFVYLRMNWKILEETRILNGKDRNAAQIYRYRRLEKLLGRVCYMGPDFNLSDQYREIYKMIPDQESLERFVAAAQKAAFSEKRVSGEEAEDCAALYKECVRRLYQDRRIMDSRMNRIYFKYLEGYHL